MARRASRLTGAGAIGLGLAYLAVAQAFRRDDAVLAGVANPSAAGAGSPKEIAPRGWIDIGRSVWKKIGDNRVVAVAAGLTFYAILAIFPAITAIVSIYGLFGDPLRIEAEVQSLAGLLPEGAITVVDDQIRMIAAQGQGSLGFAFILGLGIAIWSANAGMKALFDALNVAYETADTRNFVRLNAISLLFTVCIVALVLGLFGSTVVLPLLLDHVFGEARDLSTAITWLRWPVYLLILLLALAFLYRFGPAHKKPAWRWVTPGSIFASIAWFAASAAFAWYAAHFGSYNKTYGTLGAIIGFMTWLWVSAIVVMVGAEINAEAEREAKGRVPAADKGQASPR